MNTKGTYSIEEAFAYELEIEYIIYWDDGDYETPPESELEILNVTLNGKDISTFYEHFLEDTISEQLWEYAQENKYNESK